jgi:restriction system protein
MTDEELLKKIQERKTARDEKPKNKSLLNKILYKLIDTNIEKTTDTLKDKNIEKASTTLEQKQQQTKEIDLHNIYKENKKQENKEKNKKKGKDYEIYVGNYYENLGYAVKYIGIERKEKDNGIDLIATKDNEILYIQCKNWHKNSDYKINHEKIKAFMGSVDLFKKNNSEHQEYIKESLLYIASNDIFDSSAKAFCQENKDYVRYKQLKIKQLTTANLAIKHNMTTKEMEQCLIKNGYLEQKERGLYLTKKGKEVGEWHQGEGKGYFLWNENIELE